MKIKFLPILIFVALVTLTGCKRETTLSGQMFIVTQGGENVKLGDVEILIIDKSQTRSFLQTKFSSIKSENAVRKANYDFAKDAENNQRAVETYPAKLKIV